MPLGMEAGLSPGDFVLDGEQPTPPKGLSPKFSADVCCGQSAGWIKVALGTELGLSPGDFMLDGGPAPTPPQKFSAHAYCSQTAAWIKMPLIDTVQASAQATLC